ncbi:hypothetical protein ACH4FX_05870 [Streptomyces sp. NPDC018019]|uniref:hypothetical protein n=1 Tax=Streptomyces sp. NPDC018019 TaxID=3365030 RepID=UPI00378A5FC4
MPHPHHNTDSNAPGTITAYEDAPTILAEMRWVIDQVAASPSGSGLSREFWLRKAALLDRIALRESAECTPADAAESNTTAAKAAHRLAQYDRQRGGGPLGTANGPIPPDSPLWHPSYRPYVRQEYAAWLRMTC